MLDVVDCLRDGAGDMVRIDGLRKEAADEFERLRHALKDARAAFHTLNHERASDDVLLACGVQIARIDILMER